MGDNKKNSNFDDFNNFSDNRKQATDPFDQPVNFSNFSEFKNASEYKSNNKSMFPEKNTEFGNFDNFNQTKQEEFREKSDNKDFNNSKKKSMDLFGDFGNTNESQNKPSGDDFFQFDDDKPKNNKPDL